MEDGNEQQSSPFLSSMPGRLQHLYCAVRRLYLVSKVSWLRREGERQKRRRPLGQALLAGICPETAPSRDGRLDRPDQ